MAKHRIGSFINGVLLGSAIGTVVGLLAAPRSGKETRRILQKSAEALPELAEDLTSTLNLHAHHLSHQAVQRWDETLTRLQDAIAAGIQVSRDTANDLTPPPVAAESSPPSERSS
jgi:gas vesicle protein